VEQAGTGFALPSRTLYRSRAIGLDEARREAAERRVREWTAGHELHFREFSEIHRKEISGALDYPPEGSCSGAGLNPV
jgi:MscS family membrane protein